MISRLSEGPECVDDESEPARQPATEEGSVEAVIIAVPTRKINRRGLNLEPIFGGPTILITYA